MIARLVLISYIPVFYSTAQIVVDDDNSDAPAEGLEGDVDSRFFNINLGTLDLGQVAGTALGTTLGQLGTGFLNDCLGIGKRSVIMDKLVNKRSAQETSDDPSVDSRIIGENDVNNRIFCLNNNNGYNNGWGYSGNSGNSFSNSNSGWSSSSSSSSNSGSSYSNVNCNSCSCRYSSCRRSCYKCNSGYRGSSGTTFSQARSDTSDSNSGTSQSNNDAVQFGDA